MPIAVKCECGQVFRVAEQYAGRRGKCPVCARVVSVPGQPAPMPIASAPTAPPPAGRDLRPAVRTAPPEVEELEVVEDEEVAEVQEIEEEGYEIVEEPEEARGAITTGPARKAGRRPHPPGEAAEEITDDRGRKPRQRPRLRGDDDEEPPSRDRPRKRRRSLDVRKRGNSQLAEIFGGLGMMAGAVIWFVLGLMADRIFFYPPVLFVCEVIAFIRGIAGGSSD